MITKFFENAYYKQAAFEKIKDFRENDKACLKIKGHELNKATKARLLNNIAFLRKRYTGQVELPSIFVVSV